MRSAGLGVALTGVLLTGILLAAGCAAPVVIAGPPESSYTGPLVLGQADQHTTLDRTLGAAGRAVQCRREPVGGVNDPKGYGGETGRTAELGLKEALDEGSIDGPLTGWQADRAEADRQLFGVLVDGQRKADVIMALGDVNGGQHGWYAESYAHCNVAEFPAGMMTQVGYEFWTDRDGVVADTRQIYSAAGDHDCLPGLTLLHLGDDPYADKEGTTYVRNATTRAFPDHFDESFEPQAVLPATAVDTGFRRDGRALWLSADRRRAYVGTPGAATVEMWPRPNQPFGCA